jgi:LPXTG-site transpeptidase (sortase) family protein
MARRIRLDVVLTVVGILLLGYVGETLLETRLREAMGERRLRQAWSHETHETAVEPLRRTAPRPNSGDLLGRLEIPRLGVSGLIAEGDDDGTLRTAIGHLPSTPLPGERGNVALAAHRDTHFRALRKIAVGDRITIHSWEGETEYEVTATHVVTPQDVSVLDPTDDYSLTLITCYPFGYIGRAPKRFIVQARQLGAHDSAVAKPPAPAGQLARR